MPLRDHVEVRVVCNGTPLTEYLDPAGNSDGENNLKRYIEARTNQTFEVQVKLHPGFEFEYAPLVFAHVHVDDAPNTIYRTIEKKSSNHRRGILQVEACCEFHAVRYRNDATGNWESYKYRIGALGMSETASIAELRAAEVQKLGTIRVTVFRAKQIPLAVPYIFDISTPKVLDEIPERMMKGQAIKNNIKYENGTITEPYPPRNVEWVPMPGEAGRQYEFTFVYRSRKILQSLGCIPRSPSPSPDHSLMLERTEDMLKIAKRREREERLENMRLRAQLAEVSSRSRSSSRFEDGAPTTTTAGSSPRTPAINRYASIRREPGFDLVDLTDTFIKPEPASPATENGSTITDDMSLSTALVVYRRPTPPLFDAPNNLNKRQRENDEETEISGSAPKKMRTSYSIENHDQIPIPSVEPTTTITSTLQFGEKRKRSEDVNEEVDDLVELPPQPKRPRVFEVIDLTDD